MNFIKRLAQNSQIVEFLFIIFVVFTFDAIFIIRYGFGVSFGHWLIAFFNVAIVLATLSFIKKNTRRYFAYFIYILIMFIFFLTDSTLYFFKQDVTSIAMLLESGKNTMKIGLKYNPLSPYGILLWALILIFLAFSFKLLKQIVQMHPENNPKRYVLRTIYLLVSMLGLLFSPAIINEADALVYDTPADKSLFVQKFGSITYHAKDIVTYAGNVIKPLLYAEEYIEEIDQIITYNIADQSPLYGVLEGQNVIMIMCETCEDYAFTRAHTPNYYRLYDEGINFTNFYSAAKSNYTYDAEFKSLTSMMYFQADNFMYSFGNNTYTNALPHVLGEFGYTANSFHNYYQNFFNRNIIHPNMGFERYYAFEDLGIEENGNWPLDSIMFEKFKDVIAPVQEDPFFSFVMTVTPHGPHNKYRDELQVYYNILANDPKYATAPIELLTITAAQMNFDEGLGTLLDDLEAKNLLDDTLIILFSDHKNYSSFPITYEYSNPLTRDNPYDMEKVPFIIYSQKLGASENHTLTSHYDITPTVMDLLGISYYQDFYYGQSIFLDEKEDRPIILSFSSWISHENVVMFDAVLSGNSNPEEYLAKKMWVYQVIDKYEKMFQSNYFINRVTYLPKIVD
ncbi:MAG: sulfatase-like hydrolase/transferase [Acholeplasmataceae bacterium]|nr:sulfatase-like hydrolase/transferase [Acholeplasmataceae bacterium]